MGNSISAATTTDASGAESGQHGSSGRGTDVLGIPGLRDTREFRQILLQQFRQCMAACPKEHSSVYYEALKRTPSTVSQIEAPELKFLHFEDFNPWAASRRCVRYWTHRKATFHENAFLPLSLSNKGALKEVDLTILKSGALCLGPFEPAGAKGLLYCIDTLKLRSFMATDQAAAQRCIFFLLNVCIEHAESLQGGVTFVLFVDDDIVQCMNDFAQWQEMITNAFPIRQASVHIVPSGLSPNLGSSEITHQLSTSHKVELKVHWSHSKEDILVSLRKLGIPVEFLPERMGGSGSQQRALLWHDQRMRADLERYEAANLSSDASQSTASSFVRHQRQRQRLKTQTVAGQVTDTSVDKNEETAHLSHMSPSSSRKRTVELADLDKDTLSMGANELDRQEFIRKRNAVYSKRKYHRKKIEIEVLKKQATEMKVENETLRGEGDRLEEILHSVRAKIVLMEAAKGLTVNSGTTALSSLLPTTRTSPIANGTQLGNGMAPSPLSSHQVFLGPTTLPTVPTNGHSGMSSPRLGGSVDLAAVLQQPSQALSSLLNSTTQHSVSPPNAPLPAPQNTVSPTSMMQILSCLLGGGAGGVSTMNPSSGLLHSGTGTDTPNMFGMLHPPAPAAPPPAPPPPLSYQHNHLVTHPSFNTESAAQISQLLDHLIKAGQPSHSSE